MYTFSLFIGTIAGNIVFQAILSFIFLYLPAGLYALVSSILLLHLNLDRDHLDEFHKKAKPIEQSFMNLSLPIPLNEFIIVYDRQPDNALAMDGAGFGYQPEQSDSTIFNKVLSIVIVSAVYTLLSLIIGIKLYQKTPNEANGRVLLYIKLSRLFMPSAIICCSLLGGKTISEIFFSHPPIVFFYMAVIGTGVVTYLLLKKLINTKLVWGSK